MDTIFSRFTKPFLSLLHEDDSRTLWEGGQWKLEEKEDEGILPAEGHFRLSLVPDSARNGKSIVKAEWIQPTRDEHGNTLDRKYATRLIPELNEFIEDGIQTILPGVMPSMIDITNRAGSVMRLLLWEPTRFKLKENPESE
jgi:hypothetical protein